MLASGDYKRTSIAKACGVTPKTLRNWINKHPELEEAKEHGDWAQYGEVVDNWVERLKSGEHSASEIIFYLKNKSRILEGEDWRDRTEVEHSGEIDTGGETHIYLPDNGRGVPDALKKRQSILTNGAPTNGSSP